MKMKCINILETKRVIFAPDLLRIDPDPKNKLINTQLVNIEWLFTMFSARIEENLGITPYIVSGNESGDLLSRIEIYRELDLMMNVESWSKLYGGTFKSDIIDKYLLRIFEDSLVIGFELPPYMKRFFIRYNIPYIDMTIHPIRYLPDYILGVRSNIEEIQNKLEKTAFNESLFFDFADISKASTIRKYRNNLPEPSSALFLGQTEVDASLIYDGKMAGIEEVRESLRNLSIEYENIYFKAHPYSKRLPALKKLVESFPTVHWYEVNIYDALGTNRFDLVTSLSSGTLYEAKYFGQKNKKILPTTEKFDLSCKKMDKNRLYYPICSQIFASEYWQYLLGDIDTFTPEFPKPWENALISTLHQKWGR